MKRKVRVHRDVDSPTTPGEKCILTDPLDSHVTYDELFDAFLGRIKEETPKATCKTLADDEFMLIAPTVDELYTFLGVLIPRLFARKATKDQKPLTDEEREKELDKFTATMSEKQKEHYLTVVEEQRQKQAEFKALPEEEQKARLAEIEEKRNARVTATVKYDRTNGDIVMVTSHGERLLSTMFYHIMSEPELRIEHWVVLANGDGDRCVTVSFERRLQAMIDTIIGRFEEGFYW